MQEVSIKMRVVPVTRTLGLAYTQESLAKRAEKIVALGKLVPLPKTEKPAKAAKPREGKTA
jgi:hypothetical protein